MRYKYILFSLITVFFLSYSYGITTVYLKIFPFQLLKEARLLLSNNEESRDSHYHHKKSLFKELKNQNYDIVFIGDSLTESAIWHEFFPNIKIANRGISGDTTSGVKDRMQSILSTHAEKAFIMIGTNDFALGNTVSAVFLNYKEITEKLLENGFHVYIQSTILVGPSISMRNQSINRLNSKLEQLATLNNNITYINLNKTLAKNNMLNPTFTYDDLHLNGPGYSAWKSLIENYVNK